MIDIVGTAGVAGMILGNFLAAGHTDQNQAGRIERKMDSNPKTIGTVGCLGEAGLGGCLGDGRDPAVVGNRCMLEMKIVPACTGFVSKETG